MLHLLRTKADLETEDRQSLKCMSRVATALVCDKPMQGRSVDG